MIVAGRVRVEGRNHVSKRRLRRYLRKHYRDELLPAGTTSPIYPRRTFLPTIETDAAGPALRPARKPIAPTWGLVGCVICRNEVSTPSNLAESPTPRGFPPSMLIGSRTVVRIGMKLHIVYDPDAAFPLHFAVSPARQNDMVQANALPIEAGATCVFDMGYPSFTSLRRSARPGRRWPRFMRRAAGASRGCEQPHQLGSLKSGLSHSEARC
jgi:hypothetical protein